MCVIMLAKNARPTEEMVERAWNHNKDGVGIAWREGREKGEDGIVTAKEVVWEKGIMDLQKAKEMCAKIPLPYVVHFRVASCGGVKESLTHPFVVSLDSPLILKGRTKGALLFHNGHWGPWNDKAIDVAINSNNPVPDGDDWSDSRAIAWMISIYGHSFMSLLTQQKGVIMTPKRFNVFTGGSGWDKINDVWCSNDYFWKGRPYQRNVGRRYCSQGRCNNEPMVGREVCADCDKARREAVSKADGNKDNSEGGSSVGQRNEMSIVTGGKSESPLAKTFTMAQVEGFYKGGMLSKTILKKYRKAHGGLGEKGNRKKRAEQALRDLSEVITERLMTGVGPQE